MTDDDQTRREQIDAALDALPPASESHGQSDGALDLALETGDLFLELGDLGLVRRELGGELVVVTLHHEHTAAGEPRRGGREDDR